MKHNKYQTTQCPKRLSPFPSKLHTTPINNGMIRLPSQHNTHYPGRSKTNSYNNQNPTYYGISYITKNNSYFSFYFFKACSFALNSLILSSFLNAL